ncbi:MAG: polynucleotide adenylyltransferase PcnB [Gammaproteobacteria bacterium]|nr:polynucleotide adenylyltransferase PcnB [Gammaproteobacteria bacterium]
MTQPTIISRGEHGISRDQIDSNALKVLYRLHNAGFQAYLVGGGVRDLLLGLEPKDFDIATDATPEDVRNLFRNCRLIGRRFRLAHIHFGREIIEVATFRGEHSPRNKNGVLDNSGRILRDNVYGTLEEDVWRRDFKVNALYYNIADFSVVDFTGAMTDINDRTMRMIGDAETRYREDPVRMLRAVRFAAKLDFSIHKDSETPIYELSTVLSEIPAARLFDESIKLFHSGTAVKCFELLRHYGLFQVLFPQTEAALKQDPESEVFIVKVLQSTDARIMDGNNVNPAFVFAALLWQPLLNQTQRFLSDGLPVNLAMQKAIDKVLPAQLRMTSMPKRLSLIMKDIWFLQDRLANHSGKRAIAAFTHQRFRAAYDFLCLRSAAGEDVAKHCVFWTDLQKLSPQKQEKALQGKKSFMSRFKKAKKV